MENTYTSSFQDAKRGRLICWRWTLGKKGWGGWRQAYCCRKKCTSMAGVPVRRLNFWEPVGWEVAVACDDIFLPSRVFHVKRPKVKGSWTMQQGLIYNQRIRQRTCKTTHSRTLQSSPKSTSLIQWDPPLPQVTSEYFCAHVGMVSSDLSYDSLGASAYIWACRFLI